VKNLSLSIFQIREVVLDSKIRWQLENKQTKMDSSLVFGKKKKLLSYQDNLCWKPFPLLKMFIRNTVEMAENAMAILSKS